jgi:cytochrome c553
MAKVNLGLALSLVLISTLGHAEGNAKAGEEKAAACGGCHGADGNGSAPIFPKLANQHASYLIKQLHDFKTQKRVEPTMNAMAEPLSDEDMLDIAAYYDQLKISQEPETHNAQGRTIYRSGAKERGIPACSGCHGPEGSGNPYAKFPGLHGQYAAYIEKTLSDYKSGERANDPNAIMRSIAQKLSDEEITAVSEFASSLHHP